MTDIVEDFLAHHGVKGMRWGVRKDERLLSDKDKALNLSQRTQVRVASSISALAAVGIASNAAAAAFQLQSRFEHLKIAKAVLDQAENNPFISEAGKQALRSTKNNIVRGLISSAIMTTAISSTIGIVTHRTAKAYFAPLHKVYGDAKGQINSDLKKLSRDIQKGKRAAMTAKEYESEVAKIVAKHMTKNKNNLLQPFHELARNQLGTEYNTKSLDISFAKLPNTNLYSKMTIETPTGLKLVKAIKVVKHADSDELGEPFDGLDLFFDYKFDADGFIEEWSCPTIEIANDFFEDQFDLDSITSKFGEIQHSDEKGHVVGNQKNGQDVDAFLASIGVRSLMHDDRLTEVDDFLAHYGVKGMKWGVRRDASESTGFFARRKAKQAEKEAVKEAKKAPPGTVGTTTDKNGKLVMVQKQENGEWKETFLSADAERFIKSSLKPQHQMSDQELKAFVARANLLKQYDDLAIFNKKKDDPNQDLKDRLSALETQQRIGQIEAQMRGPSKLQRAARVASFVGKAAPGFEVFKKLDDMTGNAVSNELKDALRSGFAGSRSGGTGPSRQARAPQPPKPPKRPKSTFKVNPDKVRVTPGVFNITDVGNPSSGSGVNNPPLPIDRLALPRGS